MTPLVCHACYWLTWSSKYDWYCRRQLIPPKTNRCKAKKERVAQ